jgi:hypothetical protein
MLTEVKLPKRGSTVFVIPAGADNDQSQWWKATLLSAAGGAARPFVVRSQHSDASLTQSVARIAVETNLPDPQRMMEALETIVHELDDPAESEMTAEDVRSLAQHALRTSHWTLTTDERVPDGTYGGSR